MTAYIVGATAAGAIVGLLLGGLGRPMVSRVDSTVVNTMAVAVMGASVVADAAAARIGLPSVRRQVSRMWLTAYRDWVYGLGFGAQLGTGVATIVTTATVYATLVLEFLSGTAASGALVGTAFGAVRGLTLLPSAYVRRPNDLDVLSRMLVRTERWVRPLAITIQALVVVVAVVLLT